MEAPGKVSGNVPVNVIDDGFDHISFVVKDIPTHVAIWERLGFRKAGSRKISRRGLRSEIMTQGRARVILNQLDGSETSKKEHDSKFHQAHGDGISVMAVAVENATAAYNNVLKRGARSALAPTRYESPRGAVVRAEIWTPCDLRFAFIERKTTGSGSVLFDDELEIPSLESPAPMGILKVDHLTNNVGMGEMKTWVKYYKDIFDFKVTRHFDISTGRTGLTSDVVEDHSRRIKVPINEATEPQSQVQEFYDRFHGTGVQHVAFTTTDIVQCVSGLKKNQIGFLDVPHTYYEAVPTRVPNFTENLETLEKLGVLLDGEGSGYLLQIFTNEMVGPAFFEFIQRKGNEGFGEGNFKALFEAIERDQIKRGKLKA